MHLTTHIQNKIGDIQSNTEIITSVTRLNHEYDYIQISSTEGADYKPLEQIEISIVKNNEVLFKGTKYQLYEILKQPNQHP